MSERTRYVAGFMFEAACGTRGENVALIKKKRPTWQAGRYNGIGGHIETGETAIAAMVREFCEETGRMTDLADWYPFAKLLGPNFSVEFFCSYGDLTELESATDEEIAIMPISGVTVSNSIPNLTWLIPMARSMWHDSAAMMVIDERHSQSQRDDGAAVYLSGGIAGLTAEECNDWRQRAILLLRARALDPMRHDYSGRRQVDVAEIVDTDLRDIDDCEALLVRVEQPSWGTAMEIRYAHQLGKPIIAWGVPSVASAWLEHHCTRFYETLDEACDYLNLLLMGAPAEKV
jgi:8-oxo-dGTP diphosphatase